LEKWDLMTEIKKVLINDQEYENFIRKDQGYGNEVKGSMEDTNEVRENAENVSEIRNKNDLIKEDVENIMENNQESSSEEEMSENLQTLIEELEEVREGINEELMEKNRRELSASELCQKINRNKNKSLRDYYYLGREFKQMLEDEIKKRIGNQKKRKTDFEERKKLYQRIKKSIEKGRIKRIKRTIEKAEKTYKLFKGIGKGKLNSMCGITTVTKCNNKEIEKAIEYFRKEYQE
jgi:hypothetical protein